MKRKTSKPKLPIVDDTIFERPAESYTHREYWAKQKAKVQYPLAKAEAIANGILADFAGVKKLRKRDVEMINQKWTCMFREGVLTSGVGYFPDTITTEPPPVDSPEWKELNLPRPLPARVERALQLYDEIRRCKGSLERGSIKSAIADAIEIGSLMMWLQADAESSVVQEGRAVRKGSVKGVKVRSYTATQKRELARNAKRLYNESGAVTLPRRVSFVAKHAIKEPGETLTGISLDTARKRLRWAEVIPPKKPRRKRRRK